MLIKNFYGYEMEKEIRTSFQDYFNESIVTIVKNGHERQFSVVYLRYFEEQIEMFTPFTENPVCEIDEKKYYLRDIVALMYYLKFPEERRRTRIYISDGKIFSKIFENIKQKEVSNIIQEYHIKNGLL